MKRHRQTQASNYFCLFVFPPSFIALHLGNYTARVIAKQQTPSESGKKMKQERIIPWQEELLDNASAGDPLWRLGSRRRT